MTNDELRIINKELDKLLPRNGKLAKAMRYSMFAGGKRFRPILMLKVALVLGGNINKVIPAACAIEMIHTFTLIHDDLPAMDDSNFRRGKPTCHKVYGEDMAILAGDALSTLAFEILAKHYPSPVVAEVSRALGEVVKGQVLDLEAEGKKIQLKELKQIHKLKTGALISAAVRIVGIILKASPKKIKALNSFAQHLGLAFQITDDILDVTSNFGKMGKIPGSDAKQKKATYPGLLGLAKAQTMAKKEYDQAIGALNIFGKKADTLREIARYTVYREK